MDLIASRNVDSHRCNSNRMFMKLACIAKANSFSGATFTESIVSFRKRGTWANNSLPFSSVLTKIILLQFDRLESIAICLFFSLELKQQNCSSGLHDADRFLHRIWTNEAIDLLPILHWLFAAENANQVNHSENMFFSLLSDCLWAHCIWLLQFEFVVPLTRNIMFDASAQSMCSMHTMELVKLLAFCMWLRPPRLSVISHFVLNRVKHRHKDCERCTVTMRTTEEIPFTRLIMCI